MKRRLVIISPCRDEEQFVRITLDSVIKQTYRPDLWIIVDDGSRDRTAEIVAAYAARHLWIRLVRRERGGSRQLGPGVVNAFNAGLAALGDEPFDVIAKMDCDLEFGAETFAAIMKLFDDPEVGWPAGPHCSCCMTSSYLSVLPRTMCRGKRSFIVENASGTLEGSNAFMAGTSSMKPMPAVTVGSPQ